MKKTFTYAGLALLIATPALADNTATATVTVGGTIVQSLEIATANNLTMPHLVAVGTAANGNAGNTSVKLSCGAADTNNTLAYSGNGNPFADGVAAAAGKGGGGSANATTAGLTSIAVQGECATLNVSGDTSYSFNVVTAVTAQPTGAGGGVSLSAPECFNAGTLIATGDAIALVAGAKTLKCGATVTTTLDTTTSGSYSGGAFTVQVTYD